MVYSLIMHLGINSQMHALNEVEHFILFFCSLLLLLQTADGFLLFEARSRSLLRSDFQFEAVSFRCTGVSGLEESSVVHSFIQAISTVPLQVHYYSEVLPAQHGYCVGSFTPKRHRQLRVKDLPKVPTWQLELDLNPRPFRRKVMNLPIS